MADLDMTAATAVHRTWATEAMAVEVMAAAHMEGDTADMLEDMVTTERSDTLYP